MKLAPIYPPSPKFTFACSRCNTRHSSSSPDASADLDGPPFAAYICGSCVRLAREVAL